MSENITPESRSIPFVEVKYERMNSKDSLFQVDGVAFGKALTDLGYPSSIAKELIIDNDEQAYELAKYDFIRRVVLLHNHSFVTSIRRVYHQTLEQMGENTEGKKENLFQKIISSNIFKLVFPAYWPYRMIDNNYFSFYAGSPQRRENYLKAAKERNLEQRARAKAFIDKLTEKATQRYVAWALGHEYEHIRGHWPKFAIKTSLGVAASVAVIAIINVLMNQIPQTGQNLESSKILLQLMGGGFAGIGGLSIGRAKEEYISNEAGFRNMYKLMECFKINQGVFQREILGKQE